MDIEEGEINFNWVILGNNSFDCLKVFLFLKNKLNFDL